MNEAREKKDEAAGAEAPRDDAQEEAPQEGAAAGDPAGPAVEADPAEVLEEQDEGVVLANELVERTRERDELKDQLLRARAEFDNLRKRTAREMDRVRRTAAESLLRDLLPVLDHLELALRHAGDESGALAEGVGMVLSQFQEVLKAHGLEAIPARGETFDPNVHEALSQMPSEECEAGLVLEEYKRGYRIGDYIVRPAQVVVSSGPGPEADASAGTGTQEPDNQQA